jgi:predicted RNA-binding Zn-ribbon protein involved in translation (DUF1610 family)
MRRFYAKCPNCGLKGVNCVIYRCANGHVYCERCTGSEITPLLKLRVNMCPQCGDRNYMGVALLRPSSRRVVASSPS